jgi:hypothetical protein
MRVTSQLFCVGISIASTLYGTAESIFRMAHTLEGYTDDYRLCILGPRQLTHLATTGSLGALDITILKDIHLTIAIDALHKLPSDHLLVVVELGDEKT